MIARAFTSATGALAITAGLLLIMQLLIATGEDIITEQRIRHFVGLAKVRNDREVVTRETLPPRPVKPLVPPVTVFHGEALESGSGVHLPAPPPPDSATSVQVSNYGDGPLFNIFKVSPTYPSVAIARGLEGTVLVQYDVTAQGQVVNVVILESSHTVFNKAAVAAAYRFKYKPKTVDGVPYGANGLRNLFRFEMED